MVKDIYHMIHSFKEYVSAFYGPGAKATKLSRACLLLSWVQQLGRGRWMLLREGGSLDLPGMWGEHQGRVSKGGWFGLS